MDPKLLPQADRPIQGPEEGQCSKVVHQSEDGWSSVGSLSSLFRIRSGSIIHSSPTTSPTQPSQPSSSTSLATTIGSSFSSSNADVQQHRNQLDANDESALQPVQTRTQGMVTGWDASKVLALEIQLFEGLSGVSEFQAGTNGSVLQSTVRKLVAAFLLDKLPAPKPPAPAQVSTARSHAGIPAPHTAPQKRPREDSTLDLRDSSRPPKVGLDILFDLLKTPLASLTGGSSLLKQKLQNAFTTPEAATKALCLDGLMFEGYALEFSLNMPRNRYYDPSLDLSNPSFVIPRTVPRTPGSTFVARISPHVTDADVHGLLKRYGKPVAIAVPKETNSLVLRVNDSIRASQGQSSPPVRPQGFALVLWEDASRANAIMTELCNTFAFGQFLDAQPAQAKATIQQNPRSIKVATRSSNSYRIERLHADLPSPPHPDRFTSLPAEILSKISRLAQTDDTPPMGPICRALLSFDRVTRFNQVAIKSHRQLCKFPGCSRMDQ
ncbi:hypothetical protein JCM11641_004697 [Rhodosporidiobolus odoratus]